jgi:hypothetical protein
MKTAINSRHQSARPFQRRLWTNALFPARIGHLAGNTLYQIDQIQGRTHWFADFRRQLRVHQGVDHSLKRGSRGHWELVV